MILKKKIFFFLLFFCVSSLHGQVTIGSGTVPASGALLDLKEENVLGTNSSKGLLMPRVFLNNETELATSLDATATPGSLNANEHIGLVIYNVNNCITEGLGLYAWNGTNWAHLGAHEPRRLEYFGGHVDTGTAVTGSAMIRIGASCANNSEILINEYQTIEGAITVNGYAAITKLIVASDGVIHGIGEAELNNGAGVFCMVPFYWNENIAPIFLTPSTGSIGSFIDFTSVMQADDIIEYEGNIYVCGVESYSGTARGFIWSTPLTSLGSTNITIQNFSMETTSFSIFNNNLVMLYKVNTNTNAIRNFDATTDLYSVSSSTMPSDVLLTLGNNIYAAGLNATQAVLYNVITGATINIVPSFPPASKARVRGTVAADGTIYIVGGTHRASGAQHPLSFFWDSATGITNSNYIDLAGRPISEWPDPNLKVGAFEEIVVENGIIHLTFETDQNGQYFYWNSADNKIVDFGDIGQKMSPKSFVVTYR